MKTVSVLSLVAVLGLVTVCVAGDENHEIIEKVMKEGLKGDDSPANKVLDGKASDEEIKSLAELIGTMKGTKAPKGDQADYDKKVAALVAAIDAIAAGDKSGKALDVFDEAANCKACHTDHKPKKE